MTDPRLPLRYSLRLGSPDPVDSTTSEDEDNQDQATTKDTLSLEDLLRILESSDHSASLQEVAEGEGTISDEECGVSLPTTMCLL